MIDGCMYAVKQSIKHLRHDVQRMRALMEVQRLAALGSHENIVGYYNSWFENEQLYIQMELCDHSLSVKGTTTPRGEEILEVLYHIAKALQFMHLDKVDIYSLGVATYELVRGSSLPDSGPQICNLIEGKISLLSGYSMQFQGLLKTLRSWRIWECRGYFCLSRHGSALNS